MTSAAADMADVVVKPALSKRQRTERARKIKAEKRAAAIEAKRGRKTVPKITRRENPAKGSRILRYHLAGILDGAQYSAAVEYADLCRTCQDVKSASMGDGARGGGGGSDVLDRRIAARQKLARANREMEKLEPPTAALVEAVCFHEWDASGWMRDIGLSVAKGIPLLKLGLDELARLWGMPRRRKGAG
jgi:hypothetical protein